MRKIIYYVATSIDGFIAGPDGDASKFVAQGKGVKKYLEDLKKFDTVIMGRKTYEFGYDFGLQPGQPAYPHMRHLIFSDTLRFEDPHEKVQVCSPDIDLIKTLKSEAGSDIYLCGGGQFAGWLLDEGLIDEVILKINPIILGVGIPLFGTSQNTASLSVAASDFYDDDGLQIIRYIIQP